MAIKIGMVKEASQKMAAAVMSGNEAQIAQAWDAFQADVCEKIKSDYLDFSRQMDAQMLAQRGYRQLTGAETNFYEKLADVLRSEAPKQAFADLIGDTVDDDVMPQTIIEDVYRDLTENHPLLSKFSIQYVGYMTKWIINKHPKTSAVWGKVNGAVTKEIESALDSIDVIQAKLSCFAFIELDMLEMGPQFLDSYIRTVLTEALACGLEAGIIHGTGKDQPIGLDRDIHKGVSVSSTDGYPQKTAIKVKSFAPAEYGAVVAKMAKTEGDVSRSFDKVLLICNLTDYLTKVMPATTVLAATGGYVHDLFPFPTDVEVSAEVPDGKAILCLPENYKLLAGGKKNAVIDFSDDFKFLDDVRYFKIKQHMTGRAVDNTCAWLLDISELDPAYVTVLMKDTKAAAAASDITA